MPYTPPPPPSHWDLASARSFRRAIAYVVGTTVFAVAVVGVFRGTMILRASDRVGEATREACERLATGQESESPAPDADAQKLPYAWVRTRIKEDALSRARAQGCDQAGAPVKEATLDGGERAAMLEGGERKAVLEGGEREAVLDRSEREDVPDRGEREAMPDRSERKTTPDGGERKAVLDRSEHEAMLDRVEREARDSATSLLLASEVTGTLLLLVLLLSFCPASTIHSYLRMKHALKHEVSKRIGVHAPAMEFARYRQALEDEGKPSLWYRLSFALLMALGSNYLLAPAGLEASILGEYAAQRTPLGEPSHAFSLVALAQAPPYIVGFAGYYLHVITQFVSRAAYLSVSVRMIPDLLKRAVTVIIVGLILSGISSGEHLSRVLVFLVGIFPESGLLYLGKVARLSMQNGQNQARTTLFELTGMDLQAQQELSELGIASREELAVADWEQLLLSSGISPCLLLRAADEALLQVVAGRDLCLALTKVPIRRASELLASCAGLDPLSLDQAKADSLAQTLGHHDLRPVLTALSRNKNLARLPEIVHRYGLELPVPTAFTKPRMPATQPLSADMSVQVDR